MQPTKHKKLSGIFNASGPLFFKVIAGSSLLLHLVSCNNLQTTTEAMSRLGGSKVATATGFGYGDSTFKLLVGQTERIIPSSVPGGYIKSIVVSPDLPAGLKLSTSGVISGTPTATLAETQYTITAASDTAEWKSSLKIRVNNPLHLAASVTPLSESMVDISWNAANISGVDGYRVSVSYPDGFVVNSDVGKDVLSSRINQLDPGSKFTVRVFALQTDASATGNAEISSSGWTPYGAINADSVSTVPQEPWKASGLEGATFSENFSMVWSFYWNPGFTPVWRGIPSKAQKGDFYFNTMLNKAYQGGILGGGRDDINTLWTNGVDKFMIGTSRGRVHMWDYLPNNPDQLTPSREIGLGSTNRSTFSGSASNCYDTSTDKLYVVNGGRNRVLVFNGWPTTTNPDAEFVLGQPDFNTFAGATSATGMNSPTGVSCEGGIVAVTDFGNHRVLVWTKAITANNQAPDFIYGQTTATAGGANGGGGIAVGGVNEPLHPLLVPRTNGGYALLVVDRRNNRVVEWDRIPATPGSQTFPGAYDRVYGQPNRSSNTANSEGQSLSSMANPAGLSHERDKNGVVKNDIFWVVDGAYWTTHNARTLKFRRGTSTAIDLWGDNDGTTTLGGWDVGKDRAGFWWGGFAASRIGCLSPSGVFNLAGFVWNTVPKNGTTPSDFTDGTRCHGAVSGGKSWIAKGASILGLNFADPSEVPSPAPTPAVILGRKNFDGTDNTAVTDSYEFKIDGVGDMDAINGSILIRDSHRIAIWNTSGLTNHAGVTRVIGQPGKTTNASNQGGLSAATLSSPASMVVNNGKIFIADTGNNRVLIYNSIPTADGAAANVVLGQANGTTNATGTGLDGMNAPGSVALINGKLVVADVGNKRVLVWDTIPTANGTAASRAIDLRQYNFSLPSWYNPDALYPRWIGYVQGRVYVEQYGRILVLPDIF